MRRHLTLALALLSLFALPAYAQFDSATVSGVIQEAFNILNRARPGNAVTNPTLPDFGFITSRTGNRTMQVGAQYVF